MNRPLKLPPSPVGFGNMSNLCGIGLGSNLQSPQRQLRLALSSLRQLPSSYLLKVATFYRNPAWGRKAQPDFYNTVILLRTSLNPQQLLQCCQRIEKKQGRVRRERWGSRTLDLDLLWYGTMKHNSKKLTLPHPRMHLREFVLIPLKEIS